MNKATPIYILSGFLGSGKTTLLQRLIAKWKNEGLKPAVIMNEIGEVNLDGLMIGPEVPMAEMLGGCICCTIRSDLSMQLYELIQGEKPDVVIIEATGAANPMEIFDAVSESSLLLKLDIRPMITVVDAAHLAALYEAQQGKTYRLMIEQIRCGSWLILNKVDLVSADELCELQALLQRLNPYAQVVTAEKCEVDIELLLSRSEADADRDTHAHSRRDHGQAMEHSHEQDEHGDRSDHAHTHDDDHNHGSHSAHHSHEHVTVYTHYFTGPVNSVDFEKFIKELPREVYRGKGILHFSDTSSRFMFQYAYREADFMKINPQGDVPDVAVFIGEHFDKTALAEGLKSLEEQAAQS
ncbi:GTP-binding protein [Paenibacillus motobuensis]|uniref:CobW family GTP-binding protein n=1 Tax=Paenibacillus TaxID=44249 RepID=UPI00203DC96B|nr:MULTISPECIES: GTP-binding protein [Paenibacillus]MCM3038166.1 GTP-binding protein [Paenibacillus lutimineralis]MCM3645270.1 GTP-binding protein [Paenibacillus motobuensis]